MSYFYSFPVLLSVHLFLEIAFCLSFHMWAQVTLGPAMQRVTLDSLHEGAANPPSCLGLPHLQFPLCKVLVSHGQPPSQMFKWKISGLSNL